MADHQLRARRWRSSCRFPTRAVGPPLTTARACRVRSAVPSSRSCRGSCGSSVPALPPRAARCPTTARRATRRAGAASASRPGRRCGASRSKVRARVCRGRRPVRATRSAQSIAGWLRLRRHARCATGARSRALRHPVTTTRWRPAACRARSWPRTAARLGNYARDRPRCAERGAGASVPRRPATTGRRRARTRSARRTTSSCRRRWAR